jgi:hypothetical protein
MPCPGTRCGLLKTRNRAAAATMNRPIGKANVRMEPLRLQPEAATA